MKHYEITIEIEGLKKPIKEKFAFCKGIYDAMGMVDCYMNNNKYSGKKYEILNIRKIDDSEIGLEG